MKLLFCDGGCGETIHDVDDVAVRCVCDLTHLCNYCVGEYLYHYGDNGDGICGTNNCKYCLKKLVIIDGKLKFRKFTANLKILGARM